MSQTEAPLRKDPARKINKILAATTLDKSSDHVVATARNLAQAIGAELYLFHAYALLPLHYGSMGVTVVYPESMDGERERVHQLQDSQLRRLRLPTEEVAGRAFEIGPPHRLMIEVVRDLDIDLLVVGASENQGALAPLLGSTADRVLRQSPIPVLVARETLTLPLRKVLAPTDLSELSHESLGRGLDLIAEINTRKPHLQTLFVLSHVERTGSVQFSPDQIERFAQRELDLLNKSLSDEGGWQSTGCLRIGQPRDKIVDQIVQDRPDLVLVGTHGRSGFERFLMGSVAADVVRHAPHNVLVVPPLDSNPRHKGVARDEAADEAVATAAIH